MGNRLGFSCIGVVGGEDDGVELSDDDEDDAKEFIEDEYDAKEEDNDVDEMEKGDDTKDDEDDDISDDGNVASVQYEPSDSPSLKT